jgi:hypothetical protein
VLLRLKPALTEAQCEMLVGAMPPADCYDRVISAKTYREPVTLVDETTGKEIAVFVPGQLQDSFVREAYHGLRNAASWTNNRGTAAGSGSRKRIRPDGSVSKAVIGDLVQSSVIGFYDRYPRMDYCRECAWNFTHPEEWARALPLFAQISQLFERWCPEKFAYQKKVASEVHPDFIVPNTVFSTVTVNKNFRTACHRDGLNLENSFSAFNVIRSGQFNGGLLVFPRFRVAFACNNADVLFFAPQEVHGNTPITPMAKEQPFERISLVYYLREKMKECGSMSEERERGKMKHGGLA